MLHYSRLLFVIVLFLGCKTAINVPVDTSLNTKPTKAYQEQIENIEQGIYFRAMGNEPGWSLKISATQIEFTSLLPDFKLFTAPHVDPIRAMDANVKTYRLTTSTGTAVITIEQQKCTNTMSGQELPYTVRIEMTNNSNTSKTFSGCGYYVIDARLHDIWVLEKMNGENVSLNKFAKQLPYIEINSTNGTFMGYAGCNRMNGTVFFEKGILRFTNVSTTEMACEAQNRESELLHSLESSTTYQISNMRLTLTNPSGIELVFKKVD
ncbi:META domain-containing protein [Flavobacterium polysaccharolyticum]|uniref:META domain-containing protein n=1 Tax=Flavobacterium polysaccharolyticum TaxID=3133148 RepID=A0ABU9NSY2_9FLAO